MAIKMDSENKQNELNEKYNSFDFKFIKKDSDGLKFSCTCNKCKKEYIRHYYKIKSNFECSNCNRIIRSKEKFIKYIGDNYTLLSEFIDNNTIVQVKCKKCDDVVDYRPNDQYENRSIQCSCYKQAKRAKNVDMKRNESIKVILEKNSNIVKCKIHDIDNVIKCKIHDVIIDVIYEPKYYQLMQSNVCKECAAIDKIQQGYLDFIKKSNIIHNNKYDYTQVEYKGSQTDKVKIICPDHGEFYQLPNDHSQGSGCPMCGNKASENELDILKLFDNIEHRDRSLISPYEIDILSHEYKLAIEYDGLLWHSFGKSYPNNYELINSDASVMKTKLIEEKGYQLFRIWENEWLNPIKQNIWKSMINSKIGKTKRIHGRKCIIKELPDHIYKEFTQLNHMQGYRSSKIKLGLYYQDELVSCMSFGYPIFTKDVEYELIRFCNKINTTVIGGASKLLKYFERKYNPKSIVSYANRRWSNGNLYEQLGFKLKNMSDPNHFYFKGDNIHKLYSRHKFQKHKLSIELEIFDESLSAINNMVNNGYRIIYDCGNITYIKEGI